MTFRKKKKKQPCCVLLTQFCAGDKMEKNEMGGACGTYGGRERCAQGFWWGNLGERDHWGDQDVDGRIILRWIFRKWEVIKLTGIFAYHSQIASHTELI